MMMLFIGANFRLEKEGRLKDHNFELEVVLSQLIIDIKSNSKKLDKAIKYEYNLKIIFWEKEEMKPIN
jgi:hypothetical protein